MDTQIEDKPISSRFVRERFQWDRMSDVDWSLVRNNLASAQRVLANPDKFPRANFDYMERTATELSLFLATNLRS